jgi:sec-independent protein translocase protein TatA
MGLDNPLHIAFLLILLLLVFGAKRLPEMGRSLGSGMRGFKDTLSGEHTHEPHESVAAIPAQAPAAPAASTTVPAPQSEAAAAARSVGERVPVA